MTQSSAKAQLLWMGLTVLVAFSGLCTIFVSLLTASQSAARRATNAEQYEGICNVRGEVSCSC
jgi:hypothetical protein